MENPDKQYRMGKKEIKGTKTEPERYQQTGRETRVKRYKRLRKYSAKNKTKQKSQHHTKEDRSEQSCPIHNYFKNAYLLTN